MKIAGKVVVLLSTEYAGSDWEKAMTPDMVVVLMPPEGIDALKRAMPPGYRFCNGPLAEAGFSNNLNLQGRACP